MKKNNKLSRKAQQQEFVKTPDGTEVLKSKESRQKVRRWTYQLRMQVVLPAKPLDDGTPQPDVVLPERVMPLSTVHYGNASEARAEAKTQEDNIRGINDMYRNAKLRVECIPHETVSNETMRQLLGYRDMSSLLDRALELAIHQAQLLIGGRSLGVDFVERSEVPAVKDNEGNVTEAAKPAYTMLNIKEHFYAEAVREKTQELKASGALDDSKPVAQVVPQAEEQEEREPFVPEIVEIQRAPRVSEDATISDGVVAS